MAEPEQQCAKKVMMARRGGLRKPLAHMNTYRVWRPQTTPELAPSKLPSKSESVSGPIPSTETDTEDEELEGTQDLLDRFLSFSTPPKDHIDNTPSHSPPLLLEHVPINENGDKNNGNGLSSVKETILLPSQGNTSGVDTPGQQASPLGLKLGDYHLSANNKLHSYRHHTLVNENTVFADDVSPTTVLLPRATQRDIPNSRSNTLEIYSGSETEREPVAAPTIPFRDTQIPRPDSHTILNSLSAIPDTMALSIQSESTFVRRSRRVKNPPVNYFAPVLGFRAQDYDDGEEIPAGINIPHKEEPKDEEDDDEEMKLDIDSSQANSPTKFPTETALRADSRDISALLRSRELGLSVHSAKNRITRSLNDRCSSKWAPWKTWSGGSHDINVVSWAQDGLRFIIGTMALCNQSNMQYNRKNNLLFGDLSKSMIKELPDHQVSRPVQDSSDPDHNTLDRNLYMTVSSVQWSGEERFFTASYDQTVKVWETDPSPHCTGTINHPGRVDLMAVSDTRLIATACQDKTPIRLWDIDSGVIHLNPVSTPRASKGTMPSTLSWSPCCTDLLLAGFAGKEAQRNSASWVPGCMALWKAAESGSTTRLQLADMAEAIYDIAWHPSAPVFLAASCMPSIYGAKRYNHDNNARSLLRIYDPLGTPSAIGLYQCPALDINEATFCPTDQNYITASCTNGITYVWDRRNSISLLHTLKHKRPISELSTSVSREVFDVGVRIALWDNSTRFYTGASDGILKSWDIRRSPQDVYIEDVARFDQGLMTAAFSPDKTNLLIGDTGGGIHVLSTAPAHRFNNDPNFVYHGAPELSAEVPEGIATSNQYISSGQLSRHPEFGVGQGPNYKGPYAAWARPTDIPHELPYTPLNPMVQAEQLYGPPVHQRYNLDHKAQERVSERIKLAHELNKRKASKRKLCYDYPIAAKVPKSAATTKFAVSGLRAHGNSRNPVVIEDTSDETETEEIRLQKRPLPVLKKTRPKPGAPAPPMVIDLTGDSSDESAQAPPSKVRNGSSKLLTPQHTPPQTGSLLKPTDVQAPMSLRANDWARILNSRLTAMTELDGDSEDSEEDHWWPVNVDANLNYASD
ncbi:hypothetical protein FQN57_006833 [Myotisia sp. PD_48]|nr:hypothetical protein FQN57_006833 [Myotisia sp. PD_48]